MDFLYDPNSYLLGFRITLDKYIINMSNSIWKSGWQPKTGVENWEDPIHICRMYKDYIENYLKTKGITILANIAGFHANASQPHIHIHYNVVLPKSQPNDWLQNWKYHWKKIYLKNKNVKFLYEKHKEASKINISIKGKPLESAQDLEYFFAYTLKEGKHLGMLSSTNVIPQIEYLQTIGTGLYKKAQAQNAIKDRAKKKQLSVYKRVIARIDERKHLNNSLWECARDTLEHFQTLPVEEQIEPQVLLKYVKKYCYYSGIWDIESILEKYL